MPTSLEDQRFAQRSATVFHPINTADKTAMASLRAISNPAKDACRELQRACLSMPSWSASMLLKA
jgi:hypothetical protein